MAPGQNDHHPREIEPEAELWVRSAGSRQWRCDREEWLVRLWSLSSCRGFLFLRGTPVSYSHLALRSLADRLTVKITHLGQGEVNNSAFIRVHGAEFENGPCRPNAVRC